jgi:hypothetical protein
MGEKACVLIAALVVTSIVFMLMAPALARAAEDDDDPTLPPDGGDTPEGPQTPAGQLDPGDVSGDNGLSENQSPSGASPISPMLATTIVGIVIMAVVIAGVWKYLSGRPKAPQLEVPGEGPSKFSLPPH